MKALLIFVLLHNYPDGTQKEVFKVGPMLAAKCDAMQKAVWASNFHVVGQTAEADVDVPETDADCLPDDGLWHNKDAM